MGFRPLMSFDLFCDGGGCTSQERFETHEYFQVGLSCRVELDGSARLPTGWVMRRHHYTNMKEYFCPRCATQRRNEQ